MPPPASEAAPPAEPSGNGVVRVSDVVYQACLCHALTTEREEVMGLLLGSTTDQDVDIVASLTLARNDKRPDRCEISPEQLVKASQTAEELTEQLQRNVRVVGWYHSHPHITSLPSHVDLRTQMNYQVLDSTFVGLIFAVFNADPQAGALSHDLLAFRAKGSSGQERVELQVEVVLPCELLNETEEASLAAFGGILGQRAVIAAPKELMAEFQERREQDLELAPEAHQEALEVQQAVESRHLAQLREVYHAEVKPLLQFYEDLKHNARVLGRLQQERLSISKRMLDDQLLEATSVVEESQLTEIEEELPPLGEEPPREKAVRSPFFERSLAHDAGVRADQSAGTTVESQDDLPQHLGSVSAIPAAANVPLAVTQRAAGQMSERIDPERTDQERRKAQCEADEEMARRLQQEIDDEEAAAEAERRRVEVQQQKQEQQQALRREHDTSQTAGPQQEVPPVQVRGNAVDTPCFDERTEPIEDEETQLYDSSDQAAFQRPLGGSGDSVVAQETVVGTVGTHVSAAAAQATSSRTTAACLVDLLPPLRTGPRPSEVEADCSVVGASDTVRAERSTAAASVVEPREHKAQAVLQFPKRPRDPAEAPAPVPAPPKAAGKRANKKQQGGAADGIDAPAVADRATAKKRLRPCKDL